MRNLTYGDPTSRTIGASITVTDARLRFTRSLSTEDIASPFSYDSDIFGGLIYRAASVDGHLYTSIIEPGKTGYFDSTWTDTGVYVYSGSRLGVFQDHVFYQGADNKYYYMVFGSEPVEFDAGSTLPAAFAPVDNTHVFVLTHDKGSKLYAYTRIYYITVGGATETWPGAWYGQSNTMPLIDAHDTTVYFTDSGNLRTVYLKKTGEIWSEVAYVLPIDIVDDDSLFCMTSATVINGLPVVVGTLKRKYGLPMTIYTIGPDQFTAGRDLFVRSEDTDQPGAKLFLIGDKVYCVGFAMRYEADATPVLGYDNAGMRMTTSDVNNINLECAAGAPGRLSMAIKNDISQSIIKPGSELDLDVIVNNISYRLGKFSIDSVPKASDSDGKDIRLTARSRSCKTLIQWVSDASYDYWSQAKLWNNPRELEKVVRASGTYDTYDGALYIKDYNEDGILYATARSAHGGVCYARFRKMSGDFGIRFGVGLNYYRENKAEAAERLGVSTSEVHEDDYGSSGVFAIYSETEHNGSSGISLNIMSAGVLTKLTSVATSITAGYSYWLMMRFYEGRAYVYYRADSTPLWTSVLDYLLVDSNNTILPWIKDQRGRGALYLKNITPNALSYAFGANSTFIPLENTTGFPSSDEVIVNAERILYTGKTSATAVGPLSYDNGSIIAQNSASGTGVDFGDNLVRNYAIQVLALSSTTYAVGVSVYLSKIGYPEDGVEISLWRGPISSEFPLGTLLASRTIAASSISDSGGWIFADFGRKVEIRNGDWIVIMRNSDHNSPSSTSYYSVVKTSGSGFYLYNENTDTWINQSGAIKYIVYGSATGIGEPYSVHVVADSNLSTSSSAYINCALAVIEGKGLGNSYQVVGYTPSSTSPAFQIANPPQDGFDATTRFRVVPTLRGLTRGSGGTDAVAHSAGERVSVYRGQPFFVVDKMAYYSSEPDLSLYDVVYALARKAGIRTVSGNTLYPTTIVPSANTFELERRNVIAVLSVNDLGEDNILIYARYLENTSPNFGISLKIEKYAVEFSANDICLERLELSQAITGTVRVSVYETSVGVWVNGALLHTFSIPFEADQMGTDGSWFWITGTYTGQVGVTIHEAGMRIDNFILDYGKSGASLLSDLIGDKRFYFQDDANGNLRLYHARPEVNTSSAPYALAVSASSSQTDDIVTRIMLEGAEIHERFDSELMMKHGNFYRMANVKEINNQTDAEYFTELFLDEFGSSIVNKTLSGAGNPMIEPDDVLYAALPEGTGKVIVDDVTFRIDVDEETATFDMVINGRVPRSAL